MLRWKCVLGMAALLAAGVAVGSGEPAPIPPAETRRKLNPLTEAPDWSQLQALSGVLSREEFDRGLAEIYSDGSRFPLPWQVEDSALVVDTAPGQAPLRIAFRAGDAKPQSVSRYWRRPEEMPPLKPGEPVLKDIRIALDPGHIGGRWAHVEERWLSMSEGEAVMEGSLVLQVAKLLKPRLEALGAEVMFVRNEEEPVTKLRPADLAAEARRVLLDSGIPNPVETYLDPHDPARLLSVQWQAEKLFYRVSEIRERAVRVNDELKPDLVLCLHLNAEPWGDPRHPSFVDRNHFHLLINGCYSPQELELEDVRFEMLERLFAGVHTVELAMSGPAASAMLQATGLSPYIYITNNARRVSANPAVFARNLLANRIYHCPVLYYEPYVMNEEQTYHRLLLGHYIGRTLLGGRLTTSPLEDYARGVVRGLVDYYSATRQTHRKSP